MCLWVRAMETYAKVIKVCARRQWRRGPEISSCGRSALMARAVRPAQIVAPKRDALAEAETSLANMQAELQHKRNHLAKVNGEVPPPPGLRHTYAVVAALRPPLSFNDSTDASV